MICSATCKRWGKNWLIYSERFLQTSWLLFMIRLDSHSFFPSYVFLTVCAWANTCGQRMKEWHSDSVSEIHRERVLSKTFLPGLCDFTYSVLNPVKPSAVDESFIQCHGWLGIWETVNGEQKLTTECIENVIMMVPFSAVVLWTFGEKIGNGWKKIL